MANRKKTPVNEDSLTYKLGAVLAFLIVGSVLAILVALAIKAIQSLA